MKQTLSGMMRKAGHEAEKTLIHGLFGNAKKMVIGAISRQIKMKIPRRGNE